MVYFTLEAASKEELEVKIREYYNRYHPAGYGTMIKEPKFEGGKWVAEGDRSSSCD